MHWYLDAILRKYAKFDGRARRQEYWMFALINIIITFVLSFAGNSGPLSGPYGINVLEVVYGFAILIPSVALSIRRLHDTDRSGWWLLIGLVPILGALILLVFAVLDSDPGTNEYGPNPKTAAT